MSADHFALGRFRARGITNVHTSLLFVIGFGLWDRRELLLLDWVHTCKSMMDGFLGRRIQKIQNVILVSLMILIITDHF